MKPTKLIRSAITLLLLAVFALPALSFGSNEDADNDGRREYRQQFKDRSYARHDRMADALGLSEAQKELFDSMRDARREYANQNKGRMRGIRSIFQNELAKDKPDFNAAAAQIKQDYEQSSGEAFEVMLAANVAFFESLTDEQRQKYIEMRHDRRGKGRGHGRGNGQGRGAMRGYR